MHFILLHGSWHGAWCWDKFRPYLEAFGHTIASPDLPGHGQNRKEHLFKDIRFSDYVDTVLEHLRSQPSPSVLVGHSMAGAVIKEVAQQCSETIHHLIYLTAYIPLEGQALTQAFEQAEQWAATPGALSVQHHKSHHAFEVPEEVFAPCFYQDCPSSVLDWALAHKQQLEPSHPYFYKLKSYPNSHSHVLSKTYIVCERDGLLQNESQRHFAQREGCDCVSLNSGHSPFLSHPEPLAQLMHTVISQR